MDRIVTIWVYVFTVTLSYILESFNNLFCMLYVLESNIVYCMFVCITCLCVFIVLYALYQDHLPIHRFLLPWLYQDHLYTGFCCCCLPTPMTLASGGSPMFPHVVHQPASPSIWPAVQSLRRGLSTNPGVTMWCVCGCS